MPISEILRETLLGRIRLLDRSERRVVMHASVLGRRFGVRMLVAASGCSEERTRAALDRACGLGLIVADDPAGESFAFRHALIRDVVYGELVTTRLQPVHRRIALALERIAGTADASLEGLAYHSWAAGDARRCLRYNELAGDRAAAMFARDDARTHYARARALMRTGSSAYARLSAKLASVEVAAGDRPGMPGGRSIDVQ